MDLDFKLCNMTTTEKIEIVKERCQSLRNEREALDHTLDALETNLSIIQEPTWYPMMHEDGEALRMLNELQSASDSEFRAVNRRCYELAQDMIRAKLTAQAKAPVERRG